MPFMERDSALRGLQHPIRSGRCAGGGFGACACY